jgi:hypothetical protein
MARDFEEMESKLEIRETGAAPSIYYCVGLPQCFSWYIFFVPETYEPV